MAGMVGRAFGHVMTSPTRAPILLLSSLLLSPFRAKRPPSPPLFPRSPDSPPKSPLYSEDWIGLKYLMDDGRVDFLEFSGGHLHITTDNIRQHVLPYINGQL